MLSLKAHPCTKQKRWVEKYLIKWCMLNLLVCQNTAEFKPNLINYVLEAHHLASTNSYLLMYTANVKIGKKMLPNVFIAQEKASLAYLHIHFCIIFLWLEVGSLFMLYTSSDKPKILGVKTTVLYHFSIKTYVIILSEWPYGAILKKINNICLGGDNINKNLSAPKFYFIWSSNKHLQVSQLTIAVQLN